MQPQLPSRDLWLDHEGLDQQLAHTHSSKVPFTFHRPTVTEADARLVCFLLNQVGGGSHHEEVLKRVGRNDWGLLPKSPTCWTVYIIKSLGGNIVLLPVQ